MQVHHCDDPDLVGFIEANDRIRKAPGETAPRWWVELVELARVRADRRDGGLGLIEETAAQLGSDLGVETRRFGVLGVGFRVEDVRFHRPTIWRILAEVTVPGMP